MQLINGGPLRAPVQQRAFRTPPSTLHDGHPPTPPKPDARRVTDVGQAPPPENGSAGNLPSFDRNPLQGRSALIRRHDCAARQVYDAENGERTRSSSAGGGIDQAIS